MDAQRLSEAAAAWPRGRSQPSRSGALGDETPHGAAMGVDPDRGLSGLVEAEAHPDAGNGLGTHAHLRYRTYDCVTNCVTKSSNTSAATRTCMDVIRRVTWTFQQVAGGVPLLDTEESLVQSQYRPPTIERPGHRLREENPARPFLMIGPVPAAFPVHRVTQER